MPNAPTVHAGDQNFLDIRDLHVDPATGIAIEEYRDYRSFTGSLNSLQVALGCSIG